MQMAIVAKIVQKDQSSLTRWLNLGLQPQRDDPAFRRHRNDLDRRIGQHISTMQQ
jgi:hypothetical protein